ncbi:MAG: type IV pili twitching motility protein PilT, partial [Negativicutes bacterium]|nr:type IV pili twitching motility protein PilT [Negativicutes bacterium]
NQIRIQLSLTLQGVICQQLVPRMDGQGRVAALEIMVTTPAIRNLIREGKTHQIHSALQTGGQYGMQTMDIALRDLVKRNVITPQEALLRAGEPENLRRLLS